jgi:hypothetical protein
MSALAKLFDPLIKQAAKTYQWRLGKELNKMGKKKRIGDFCASC